MIHFPDWIKYMEKMAWQWNLKICWKPQKIFIFVLWNHLDIQPCRECSVWEGFFILGDREGVAFPFMHWAHGHQRCKKARSIPDREGKGGGSEKHGDRPRRQNRKFWLKRKCFNAILKTFCSETPCCYREVKEKQLSADSAVWSSHPATHRLLSLSLRRAAACTAPVWAAGDRNQAPERQPEHKHFHFVCSGCLCPSGWFLEVIEAYS